MVFQYIFYGEKQAIHKKLSALSEFEYSVRMGAT